MKKLILGAAAGCVLLSSTLAFAAPIPSAASGLSTAGDSGFVQQTMSKKKMMMMKKKKMMMKKKMM